MSDVTYRNGRHPVVVGHLVMGLAFLGLAIIWIVAEQHDSGWDDLRWLLPLPWLAAGGIGLLVITLKTRQSHTPPPTATAPEDEASASSETEEPS